MSKPTLIATLATALVLLVSATAHAFDGPVGERDGVRVEAVTLGDLFLKITNTRLEVIHVSITVRADLSDGTSLTRSTSKRFMRPGIAETWAAFDTLKPRFEEGIRVTNMQIVDLSVTDASAGSSGGASSGSGSSETTGGSGSSESTGASGAGSSPGGFSSSPLGSGPSTTVRPRPMQAEIERDRQATRAAADLVNSLRDVDLSDLNTDWKGYRIGMGYAMGVVGLSAETSGVEGDGWSAGGKASIQMWGKSAGYFQFDVAWKSTKFGSAESFDAFQV
jgi:hypothetical protein